MNIDYERIKAAFPGKAWAYAEGYDAVIIAKWTGDGFALSHNGPVQPLKGEFITALRVFDDKRELMFNGDKCRDTADYDDGDFISELAEARYYMYGERARIKDGATELYESRGGVITFPAELSFPKTDGLPNGAIGLKLGVRNYVRYNPVPVLPKGEEYDFGLGGAGAIEVVDYAYTGFYYVGEREGAKGEAVEL